MVGCLVDIKYFPHFTRTSRRRTPSGFFEPTAEAQVFDHRFLHSQSKTEVNPAHLMEAIAAAFLSDEVPDRAFEQKTPDAEIHAQ